MPGLVRTGLDTAGGLVNGSNQDGTVKCEGYEVAVHGATVASHGDSPHSSATLIASSNNVFINGKAVCVAGNLATCGHTVTGSSNSNGGTPPE